MDEQAFGSVEQQAIYKELGSICRAFFWRILESAIEDVTGIDDAAWQERVIKAQQVLASDVSHESPEYWAAYRDLTHGWDAISAKVIAWEWIFEPWKGGVPRVSLEICCEALHHYEVQAPTVAQVRAVVARFVRPPVSAIPAHIRAEFSQDATEEERRKEREKDEASVARRRVRKAEAAKMAAARASVATVVAAAPLPDGAETPNESV